MSGSPAGTATAAELFERRVPPLYHLADDASAIATACHAMAVRFHRGGSWWSSARRSQHRRPAHRGRVRPPGDRRQARAARHVADRRRGHDHRDGARDGVRRRCSPTRSACSPRPPTSRWASRPTAAAPACCAGWRRPGAGPADGRARRRRRRGDRARPGGRPPARARPATRAWSRKCTSRPPRPVGAGARVLRAARRAGSERWSHRSVEGRWSPWQGIASDEVCVTCSR